MRPSPIFTPLLPVSSAQAWVEARLPPNTQRPIARMKFVIPPEPARDMMRAPPLPNHGNNGRLLASAVLRRNVSFLTAANQQDWPEEAERPPRSDLLEWWDPDLAGPPGPPPPPRGFHRCGRRAGRCTLR